MLINVIKISVVQGVHVWKNLEMSRNLTNVKGNVKKLTKTLGKYQGKILSGSIQFTLGSTPVFTEIVVENMVHCIVLYYVIIIL